MTTFEQQPLQEPVNQEKRQRRGFILLMTLAVSTTVVSLLVLVRALLTDDALLEPVIGLVVGISLFVSVILAKRGQMEEGVVLATIALFSLDIYMILIFANMGLPFTLAIMSITALVISQSWIPKQASRGISSIVIIGILIILADLYWPAERGMISSEDMRIIYAGVFVTLIVSLIVAASRFSNYTLRGKLVAVSVLLVTVTVLVTIFSLSIISRNALSSRLEKEMFGLGLAEAEAAADVLVQHSHVLEALSLDSSLRGLVRNQNITYENEEDAEETIREVDELWAEEDGRPALAARLLLNPASRTLETFQRAFPQHLGVMVTDEYGGLAGATYTPERYDQSDTVWWQTAYNNGDGSIYIGQPEYDSVIGEMVIPIAMPVYTADTNSIVGILRTAYSLESFLTAEYELGDTGTVTVLFDDVEATIGEEGDIRLQPSIIGFDNITKLQAGSDELFFTEIDDVQEILVWSSIKATDPRFSILDDLNWGIVVQQEALEAFAPVEQFRRVSVILGVFAIVSGGVVMAYVGRWITTPIKHLTETAVSIADGDIERHAVIETHDEIGTLAAAFNSMTDQLRHFISSLEDRVTIRTQALVTSSEVSRTLSTIVSVDVLVDEVVRQMYDAFGYYHAQLFLLDEESGHLVLRSGSGDVGKKMLAAGHYIQMGQGVVGRAALANETVLINDVSQDDGWLYNPDLPDTQGEIAVPVAIGDRVLGVLDIQHNVANSFKDETVSLLYAIATQTALALQNARTFERAEQQQAILAETLSASEQQSHNLKLLNELSASLTVATTLDDVYHIAETRVMELMQAERMAILRVSDSGSTLDVVSISGMENEVTTGTSLPFEGTVAGVVVTENRLIRLPDERPLSDFIDNKRWQANNVKSVISAPLSIGTTAFGAINIGSTHERAFDSIDIGFVFQLANLLAIAMESQRLAEEARLLASIVENHPDFIGVGTADGRALYVNPSGLQMMGLPPDHDVTNMDSESFYGPDDAARLMEVGLPAAVEQGSWSTEATLLAADGSEIPVEETVGINFDVDGNVSGFSITMRDVTDRNIAAKALRDSEQTARDFQEKLTRLHEIGTVLGRAETLHDIYQQAIELGRSELGFDRLGLWLFDENGTRMFGTFGVDMNGVLQDEQGLEEMVAGSWIEPILQAKQRRQVRLDSDLHYADQVVGRGWHIMTVMYHEDRPLGWLAADNLLSRQRMQPYEPELMTLFTNLLANVIVSKRTADIFVKQAHDLQIVTEISRTAAGLMDRDTLLQFVADEMRVRFDLYHVQIFMLHEQSQILRLTAVSNSDDHPSVDLAPRIPVKEQVCIVSRAAYRQKVLFVNDVQLEPSYISVADLPDTRAVLSVPLILGRELLGVINLHARERNYFSEVDINVQQSLAAQIAAALQNVAQYQEAQEALTELTQLQQMVSRENWRSFMTDESRTTQGYLFDQHMVQAIEKGAEETVLAGGFMESETAVVAPLTVQGITIGGLSARDPAGEPLTADQQELLAAAAHQIAGALERARLLEVTELGRQTLDMRASELALLNEISEVVSAQLDLDSLFGSTGQHIQNALDATSVFFALYDPAEQRIDFPYYYSDEDGEVAIPSRPADEKGGFTARIIMNHQPFIFNRRGGSDDEFTEQGGRLDGRTRPPDSFLGVPMIVGDDLVGVIGVNSYRERRSYNAEDQRLLSTLAGTVGVAVQNVRQFEATQARARREQVWREISSRVNTAVDPESILRIAAQEIGRTLGWQTYVYLAEPDDAEALEPAEIEQPYNQN